MDENLGEILGKNLSKVKKGLFIVFEGIDGCGKTTQANRLADTISQLKLNTELYLTTEPFTETELGKTIRKLLKEKQSDSYVDALLFTANRMEHMNEIYAHLSKNHIIICDRYLDSTLNYQETDYFSSKTPFNTNFREWLLNLNKYIIFPNIVFILDLSIEQCMKNLRETNKQKEKFENWEFLTRLKESYTTNCGFQQLELFGINNFNIRCETKYKTIFCDNKSIDEIRNEILDYLLQYLKELY